MEVPTKFINCFYYEGHGVGSGLPLKELKETRAGYQLFSHFYSCKLVWKSRYFLYGLQM